MAGVTACPVCSTELPLLEGYMTWCHNCGWNVLAPEQPAPRTRSDRLYDSLGRRLGDRLAKDLLERDEFEPTLSAARVGAFVNAGAVFLLTLGFVALGATLVVLAYWNPFTDVARFS